MTGLDLFTLYRNYLACIQAYEQFGDQYGDSINIIRRYEAMLKEYGINKNYEEKKQQANVKKKVKSTYNSR